MEDFFEKILNENGINRSLAGSCPPLVLAYIGDAVYEVFIRTYLISQGSSKVHNLHLKSTAFVKAKAQSDIIHGIMDGLTEEEQDLVRRGRNARSGTIPKNADVTEYKYATGFEALIGYLYLNGRMDRLIGIMKRAVLRVESFKS